MDLIELVDIRVACSGAVGTVRVIHILYATPSRRSKRRLCRKRSPAGLGGLAPRLMLGNFTLLFTGEVALHAGGVFEGACDRLRGLGDDDTHLHGFVLGLGQLRVVRDAVQ